MTGRGKKTTNEKRGKNRKILRPDGVIWREEQNCLQSFKGNSAILFWYKKTVIPKRKYMTGRDLKDGLTNLPLKGDRDSKRNVWSEFSN